jgi:hypothetical protein
VTLQLSKRFFGRDGSEGEDRGVLLGLVVWLCGALALGVLVAHPSRFGGSIYPLEALVCVAVLHSAVDRVTRRPSIAAFSLISLAFLWNAVHRLHRPSAPTGHSMSDLIEAMQHNPADDIYVLNSVPAYSNPASIARYAGLSGHKVTILNEANGCAVSAAPAPSIREQGQTTYIKSVLPECAGYEFDQVPLNVMAEGFDAPLARGKFATYRFPEGKVLHYSMGDAKQISDIDLGREMDVDLYREPGRSFAILYYDWNAGRFLCAGDGCSKSGR